LNLQEKIDKTEEYGTLVLEFNEYFGQAVISRPIAIDGQNSTVCAKTGPVLCINSEQVELRNLRLEVTSAPKKENTEASLALHVKEDIRVRLENIVVRGNVSGLVNQDGFWEYPDVLHIWPVVPKKKNYFVFEMNIPVSCVLETGITGLKIMDPGMNPGLNKVRLEVEVLKEDTILFGQIEVKSIYLTRIISVSGGTFGIPANISKPNKNKPIDVTRSLERPGIRKQKTKKTGKKYGNRGILLGLIGAISIIIAGLAYYLLPAPAEDTRKPIGKISGIRDSYTAGETVSVNIQAEDNKSLKTMMFRVNNQSVRKSWNASGRSARQNFSFSTSEWRVGTYTYSLLIEDSSENAEEYTGTFLLKEVRYGYVNISAKPRAEIYINGKSYGNTPRFKLKLPAGRTNIRFVSKSHNIDVTKTLIVKSDETIKKRFELK